MATGVFKTTKKDNSVYYRTSINYKGKHISLGSFDAESDAVNCYTHAKLCLYDDSYTISGYSKDFSISFGKWVILVNFRDNNIYFPNPIYIYKNYFLYYLDEETILKFDRDDLFYYSSHKIMKRGGHLFVSDYGMQYNLLNRYGIMSYGVKSRDYAFRNGDEHDFRYENIEVLNSYRGVRKVDDTYEVYIHVNGNIKVGTYDSNIKAAIAYNKAADILSHSPDSRKYQLNYVAEVSPKEYADIYSEISVSRKLYAISSNNQ